MATLQTLLTAVALLSLWSASAMFLIQKNRWDELYQVHRRLWMPEWCVNCAYMWLAILPALLLAVFVHPLIVVAPVLVPPFANLLHLGRW